MLWVDGGLLQFLAEALPQPLKMRKIKIVSLHKRLVTTSNLVSVNSDPSLKVKVTQPGEKKCLKSDGLSC